MNHPIFLGLSWTINSSISLQLFKQFNLTNPYITDFLLKRSGPFTIPGACEAIGFMNTRQPEKHSGPPDIELLFIGVTFKDFISAMLVNIKKSTRQEWIKY